MSLDPMRGIAARVARFMHLRRTRPRSATGSSRSTAQNPIFDPLPGKNDPHSGIPVGFSGSGWAKLGGKKCLDSRAFGGL